MIVDMLIAEIAAESGENPKELKDKLVQKIEEEKRAGMDAGTPTPTSSENTHGVIANERKR